MGSLKVDVSGQRILIGVRDFGGSDTNQAVTGREFAEVTFRFTTGSSNASANVYVTKPAGSGYGYADCLFLVQAYGE